MPTASQTATTITMPQLGESVTEGTIGNWLKQVGDRVERFDPLVEVVTDKVNAEVPSPVAGRLLEILVAPETTVPVGTGLCLIEEAPPATAEPAAPAVGPAAGPGGNGTNGSVAGSVAGARRTKGAVPDEVELLRARSSPVVRRLAEEHGVDLGRVTGSGIGGRVTKQDLLAHMAAAAVAAEAAEAAARVEAPPVAPPPRAPAPSTPRETPPRPIAPGGPEPPVGRPAVTLHPGDEVIPLTPMRRQIAEHMVRSERTAPHVTVVMEVDMTGVVACREARKASFRRREGVDLTFLPFAIKAATLALRDHPRLNAVWDGDRIIHRGAVNVGVAVALDDGLIVPVIRNADRLSVTGLAHAVADLAEKARTGRLTPDDVAGGTFTINNPGTFGSLVSTPILVEPQAAILSTEAVVKRPVVVGDMIGVRSMMNLSLSIDHRVLDGLAAARFLRQVKGWLEGIEAGFEVG